MVLLAADPAQLQALLDALQAFCLANGLRVNVGKSEIVVFGKRAWSAPRGHAPCRYAGETLPVSPEFKYLGITLHSRGMRAAIERLHSAGQRAIWAMHGRCTQHGLTDFASRTRMFRVLAAPILTTALRSGALMPCPPSTLRCMPPCKCRRTIICAT